MVVLGQSLMCLQWDSLVDNGTINQGPLVWAKNASLFIASLAPSLPRQNVSCKCSYYSVSIYDRVWPGEQFDFQCRILLEKEQLSLDLKFEVAISPLRLYAPCLLNLLCFNCTLQPFRRSSDQSATSRQSSCCRAIRHTFNVAAVSMFQTQV